MTSLSSKTIAQDAAPASKQPGSPPGTIAWLGDFVLSGLAHCCCAHYALHPDLLGLSDRSSSASATSPSAPKKGRPIR